MLKLYNTASKRKERFRVQKEPVGVYVCGITPDAKPHLGHAFTYVVFDVLVRYLRSQGIKVRYVQNLTDIDDDLLKRAKKAKKNWRRFGNENTQAFLRDLQWLNVSFPDVYARAGDHIPEMQEIIRKLLKKQLAYERKGSVYGRSSQLGELSKLSRVSMLALANERGNNPSDRNKEDPLDFVLWQKEKSGEPSWFSPWGKGRPGWHIECSAMAMKYLGETLDIHGGGDDLFFPHHEASRAQAEGVSGKRFVRHWMHTAMVRYKGEKMAKSLGNLVFPSELKARYSANELRLFLLSHRYRTSWEFKEKNMGKAREKSKLFKKVWAMQSGQAKQFSFASFRKNFFAALNDDLDTPRALSVLEKLSRDMIQQGKKKNVSLAKAFLKDALGILGIVPEFA